MPHQATFGVSTASKGCAPNPTERAELDRPELPPGSTLGRSQLGSSARASWSTMVVTERRSPASMTA